MRHRQRQGQKRSAHCSSVVAAIVISIKNVHNIRILLLVMFFVIVGARIIPFENFLDIMKLVW